MRPLLVLPVVPILAACGGTTEAPTVALPVTSSAPLAPVITDLGYEVTLTRARAGVTGVVFTLEGDVAEAGDAIFHPGHSAGGEVAGELPGDHVLVWDGAAHPLGDATLTVGAYFGADWTWRAVAAAELGDGDPLAGHAVHLEGVARKGGVEHPFDAVLALDDGAALTGAGFELEVTEAADATLAIALLPADPVEGDTIVDGVDFAALVPGITGVIAIRPGSPPHAVLARAVQVHDHYTITSED